MSDYNIGTALRQLDGLARLLHDQDDERAEEMVRYVKAALEQQHERAVGAVVRAEREAARADAAEARLAEAPDETAYRLASHVAAAAHVAGYPVRGLEPHGDEAALVLYLALPEPWRADIECYNDGELVGSVAPGPRAEAEFWTLPGTADGARECMERIRAALAATEDPDGH